MSFGPLVFTLSLDAMASVAYGPEAIVLVLTLAGGGAYGTSTGPGLTHRFGEKRPLGSETPSVPS